MLPQIGSAWLAVGYLLLSAPGTVGAIVLITLARGAGLKLTTGNERYGRFIVAASILGSLVFGGYMLISINI